MIYKILFLSCLYSFCFSIWGSDKSLVLPPFLNAMHKYVDPSVKKELSTVEQKIKILLEKRKINKTLLQKILQKKLKNTLYLLPSDDRADKIIKKSWKNKATSFPIALQSFKMDIIEEEDDVFNDDIYCYYFITEGVIPTGKTTSIYRGLDQGNSFFFNETDRAIFPLHGIPSKVPKNHLIIDYGIVESDSQDIEELKKITAVILDIALLVYTATNPGASPYLPNLRKEVKKLSEYLLNLDDDDRLVTHTISFTSEEIQELLSNRTFYEFSKTHQGKHWYSKWKYRLHFRFLADKENDKGD